MKTAKKIIYAIAMSLIFNQVYAQYSINKHSINNGGSTITGGSYSLTGSIGQIDAGSKMTNSTYSLNPGFWEQSSDLIFKNSFE